MSLSFWIRDYVFMPLVTLRRNVWWPYAGLIISMVIFGFWHGAKLTFAAWGLYHGILLVGHRLGQRLKRRIPIDLPYPLGVFLSWAATFLLVSLGYIFFRANDLGQVSRMLGAVISPRSYAFSRVTLSQDYYLLLSLLVGGYFAYVALVDLLGLWATRYRENLRRSEQPRSLQGLSSFPSLSGAVLWIDGVLVERKWWLLTPVLVLLLMVTSLSFLNQNSNIAPFIYTLF